MLTTLQKYWRRFRVCEREIETRDLGHGTDADRQAWAYVRDLVKTLGPEGMSSEDSGYDEEQEDKVYRVTIRDCRRDCDDLLVALDKNHLSHRIASGRWGRIPVPRQRPGISLSERPAPTHWPRALYDGDWWEQLKPGEKKQYADCKNDFNWKNVKIA